MENQRRLFFWYRNRSHEDYAIQGWRDYKIYPDFILTARDKTMGADYAQVYVVEMKGRHLVGNDDTEYKRRVFSICNRIAESRSWVDMCKGMKDKDLRFEVLPEDEWEARLNELLVGGE